ncbi:GFA family protein [Novosphingobium sp. PASSN1]|uniref:GFA family protein n=1 Tax=Novosphingobium sp. PASSN1 TaxID=2015561 RepID=UPI000BD31884|nr:GFA family protein [Novosphingobium sp. PASSN1]OYU33367.1 MAG: aldehyde-activating protein [Novosphingobium sp. PASSN1]
MTHPGGCLCGAVRFTISAEPIGARMCWCRDCQRIASGSATVNVLFPEEAVSITGDLGLFTMIADSGNTVERGFCKVCGSQIYSRTVTPKGLPMRIRAGVLDNPELCPPTTVIWGDSAPSWAPIPAEMPRLPKGPPPV